MQRAYAWTFLVPAVAVVIEAIHGALPSPIAMIAVVLVIVGVAIVNLPRAEAAAVEPNEAPHIATDDGQPAPS
ncbi:MAG TPA: hypothetical protein VFH80_02660 [Solirubrobacteraceae bacterium]|nr:hypothetical protein [Solirubrobacteraceae bacterium]